MATGPDKRAQREASERIEKGIEAYAAGDLATTVRELEEALKLAPGHPRAQQYLGWARDLSTGKRKIDTPPTLDEDTLQAVADALLPDEPSRPGFSLTTGVGDDEKTREKRH